MFFGANQDKDPVMGSMGEDESFSIPGRPVRKRLQGLPRFVVTRGGEYCFMPSITALKWLSELES